MTGGVTEQAGADHDSTGSLRGMGSLLLSPNEGTGAASIGG